MPAAVGQAAGVFVSVCAGSDRGMGCIVFVDHFAVSFVKVIRRCQITRDNVENAVQLQPLARRLTRKMEKVRNDSV